VDTSSTQARDPVNFGDQAPEATNHAALDLGSLFTPAGRRHAIPIRVARGDATSAEIVHHLLGAYASDTLTGALAQAHVFAELVADGCADRRHIGTLANHLVAVLAVCVGLSEQLDLDGGAP
jgi:hypothetical protein